MIISSTATTAILLETGNTVTLLFPIRLRKSPSHAHCLAAEWTAQTLLRLLWSLLKCSSSAAHSVSSPTLQRLLRRWLPSPTKQNSCSPSFISLYSICHFLTCYPFVLSLVTFFHRSLHNLRSRFIVMVHGHFGWRENVHKKEARILSTEIDRFHSMNTPRNPTTQHPDQEASTPQRQLLPLLLAPKGNMSCYWACDKHSSMNFLENICTYFY